MRAAFVHAVGRLAALVSLLQGAATRARAEQEEVDGAIVAARRETAERLLRAVGCDLGRRPGLLRRSPATRQLEHASLPSAPKSVRRAPRPGGRHR